MSYKYTVLNDNPLAFFLLDEVRSGEAGVYSNILTLYSTYQDLKDNGISYAAVSGLPIIDYSGNGMEGYAISTSDMEVLPIIGGGVRGTEINENTEISLKALGIASNKNPDGAFSFEIWFSPDVSDTEEYLIVGDPTNEIGLFYKDENVIFRCSETDSVWHKVANNKAMHIIGVFSKDKMSLYIDGKIVAEKFIGGGFKFTNSSLNLFIGPANAGKKFIVDSAAIYNYEINEAIALRHYNAGYKETKYSQIVYTNEGILFSLNSSSIRPDVSYRYPGIKSLDQIVSGDAYYNPEFDRIEFAKTDTVEAKSFSFEERIYVLGHERIVSSKIMYGQDVSNILVEARIPGEQWVVCNNNSPLPYFNKNDNLCGPILDIRVTMTTDDSSFDLPYFDKLEIDMYSNKDFYADNSGSRIYSDYDYSLGQYNYPVRMQNKYNGLSMLDGHGFSAELSIEPMTIETFFTPRGDSNVLFSSDSSSFGWSESGAITKSGIDKIYVNGVDVTGEANKSTFLLNDISHHILIILDEPANNIKFNQNQSGSEYGSSNTYNNIAFYNKAFTPSEARENYDLYCSDNSVIVLAPGLSISESGSGIDQTAYFVRSFDTENVQI
jgi:hypothetical protein